MSQSFIIHSWSVNTAINGVTTNKSSIVVIDVTITSISGSHLNNSVILTTSFHYIERNICGQKNKISSFQSCLGHIVAETVSLQHLI